MNKQRVVGVVDYGCGNFASVVNTLNSIINNDEIIRVTNNNEIASCTHVILPGVGAFAKTMRKLKELNLLESIQDYIAKNKPFLGICVGMQIMAEWGNEFGRFEGIGYIKSEVIRFETNNKLYKIPHIGWNSLINTPNNNLYAGIPDKATFYFVHSYYMQTIEDHNLDCGISNYAGINFLASFSKGNIHGVQFHPEKSQYYGKLLLKNFIDIEIK